MMYQKAALQWPKMSAAGLILTKGWGVKTCAHQLWLISTVSNRFCSHCFCLHLL